MNENQQHLTWEQSIAEVAREFPYPLTPNIAPAIRHSISSVTVVDQSRRRPAPSWAAGLAVAIAVLVLSVLAVPQTRAALLTLISRIGAISVFMDESLPPVATASPAPAVAAPATAGPTPVPLALLAAVPGQPITMDAVDEFESFRVRQPGEASEWGAPDSAVLHHIGGRPLVTLIWEDPDQPGRPILTLSQTDIPQLAFKMVGAGQAAPVSIGEQDGLWISGPHTLQLPIDGGPSQVWIASNVLVWSDGIMTFRIEGDITQIAAVRLAESLAEPAGQ